MATPRNIVGPQLRRLRVDKGLSQQMLAELLQRRGWDISRGIVARIEGQVRWVADFELVVMADALGVDPSELLSVATTRKTAAKLARTLQRSSE